MRTARTLLALLLPLTISMIRADSHPKPSFSSPVVDLGIVVRDLDRSVAFYRDVLGCKELDGFDVAPAFAADLGLTDRLGLEVRVLSPGGEGRRTRLKLMSFPQRTGATTDQTFIHSSLGFSYLTFRVADLDASVAALRKARVKLEGKTPLELGSGDSILVCRDPDGNFVELIGPYKG